MNVATQDVWQSTSRGDQNQNQKIDIYELEDTAISTLKQKYQEFENVQITNTRSGNWRDKAIGFGVDWLPDEPDTRKPEKRCVTGKIVPTCGWENVDDLDLTCFSTGHGFKYVIEQTNLSRN